MLIAGIVITGFGFLEVVWAVFDDAPRHMVAQGMFFTQLGLAFLFQATMADGILRTTLAAAFGVTALVSLVFQYRMMRARDRGTGGGADRHEPT